jgi:hypothetical protein
LMGHLLRGDNKNGRTVGSARPLGSQKQQQQQ